MDGSVVGVYLPVGNVAKNSRAAISSAPADGAHVTSRVAGNFLRHYPIKGKV